MYKPEVDRKVLIALSGVVWSVVGFILCKKAVDWLSFAPLSRIIPFGSTGLVLALLIHFLGFRKLVNRNIERILSKGEKLCIFAFQAWKSYVIVAVMVGMGIALRASPLPREYLAVIYIGFGGAMLLSSLRYYQLSYRLTVNPPAS
jgi:hypothetical protein